MTIEPIAAFDTLRSALDPVLRTAGFAPAELPIQETPLGGQVAVYDRGEQAIRLVWDPEQTAFILEARPPSLRPFSQGWIDLTLQHFDREQADQKWVAEILEDLTNSLAAYFESPLE